MPGHIVREILNLLLLCLSGNMSIQWVQLYLANHLLSQVGPYWVTVLDALALLTPKEAGRCGVDYILPNPGWLSSKVV